MKQVQLNFYQRITLWNLIGNYNAPRMGDAFVMLRIHDKIRPTEEEAMATQLATANDQMRWQLPSAGYGNVVVALEEEEASRLAQALEAQQGVRVADAAWMFPLLDQLKPEKAADQ
jgi:hypothetical protein